MTDKIQNIKAKSGVKMFKILVVEDDKNLKKLIKITLTKENYTVYEASNGEEALEMLDTNYVDLIISDVMMPEMDGFELIKELRTSKYKMPIMLITAKDSIEDKKEGFILGADDYMVKPINLEELILRTKVLLRRSNLTDEKQLKIGKLILNYNQMAITRGKEEYFLAQKEFLLLYKLLSNPDKIYSRQELIEEIWGLDNESDYRTVDVHIKRIREKMCNVDEFEIITARGMGYKAIIREV